MSFEIAEIKLQCNGTPTPNILYGTKRLISIVITPLEYHHRNSREASDGVVKRMTHLETKFVFGGY